MTVQHPHQAVETAALAMAKVIVETVRATAAETRGESDDVADGMVGIADAIEEKMESLARDLRDNYARALMAPACFCRDATHGHGDRCPTLAYPFHADGRPKIAPVQGYTPGIPWEMHLRAYDAYRAKWSSQAALIDLERRGCRGGFGTEELDQFIPGWRDELSEITKLRARIAELEATHSNVDEAQRLGQALFELSAHLCPLLSESGKAHAAYEKVVASFAVLTRSEQVG